MERVTLPGPDDTGKLATLLRRLLEVGPTAFDEPAHIHAGGCHLLRCGACTCRPLRIEAMGRA